MSREIKIFKTIDNFDLIVKIEKGSIIFETSETESGKYEFNCVFNDEVFKELLTYIEVNATAIWKGFSPKDATSIGTDYAEYYDRKLDNNGYLDIKENMLTIDRPSLDSTRLYIFNKGKAQSFVYDFKIILKKKNI